MLLLVSIGLHSATTEAQLECTSWFGMVPKKVNNIHFSPCCYSKDFISLAYKRKYLTSCNKGNIVQSSYVLCKPVSNITWFSSLSLVSYHSLTLSFIRFYKKGTSGDYHLPKRSRTWIHIRKDPQYGGKGGRSHVIALITVIHPGAWQQEQSHQNIPPWTCPVLQTRTSKCSPNEIQTPINPWSNTTRFIFTSDFSQKKSSSAQLHLNSFSLLWIDLLFI